MSMITGCPACGTMFKVVADQLKISEGWVRCGCCGEVFDATQSLRPDAGPVPATPGPAPAPPAATAAGTGPVSMAKLLAVPVSPSPSEAPAAGRSGRPAGQDPRSDPQAGPHPKPSPGPATKQPLDTQSGSAPEPSVAPAGVAMAAELPGSASGQSWDSEPAAAAFRSDEPMREQEDEGGSLAEAPDSEPGSGLDEVSFVRQARRQAFWRRPLVRLALLLAALALAGVLALQLAVHDRDRLAQAQPRLRPLLEQVCSRLGCSVTAPRRIDAIVIDSSGFTRLRPDVYRLSFTIKNQSPLPVATPALQLTLTDSGEQAVLQRVLLPRELGAAPATIGPATAWSSSVALGVDAAGGDASRIAGYRLLAFYP